MKKNTFHYEELLKDEYKKVKHILDSLGKPHPDNKNDYDAVSEKLNNENSDSGDTALNIESLETRIGLEAEMEKRLNEITAALSAINNSTYGKCTYCGTEINDARLEANPAALTCISCANKNTISSTI